MKLLSRNKGIEESY